VVQQLINVSEGTLVMTDTDEASEPRQVGGDRKRDNQSERANRSAQN